MANMTEREFLNKVLAIEGLPTELSEYANEGLAKLDARNDKRKNTQTKTQKENEGVMATIVETITARGAMVAADIGAALGITTQKASALCRLLTDNNTLKSEDIKVKGKGSVKQYSLAVAPAEVTDTDATDAVE